jgi:hypothetical protein
MTRSECKSRQKRKPKAVTEKEERSMNDKSEYGVFVSNENEYISSKRNLLGSNHLLQQTKQNNQEN